MRTAYNERRRYLMHTFKEMGLRCFEPFGAFYVFPNIQEFGMTSEEFATELLREEKVAVVPGSAFGASGEGYIRIFIGRFERSARTGKSFYRKTEKKIEALILLKKC